MAFLAGDDVIVLDGPANRRNQSANRNQIPYANDTRELVVVDLASEEGEEEQPEPTFEPVTLNDALDSILQVLPDIDPEYVKERFNQITQGPNLIEILIAQILEEPYPRINRKRNATVAELDEKSKGLDYSDPSRRINDPNYKRVAYDVLCSKFPKIPATVINHSFATHNHLYAPAFLRLHKMPRSDYTPIKTARKPKQRIQDDLQSASGRLVSAEIAWIEAWLENEALEEEKKRRKKQEEEDEETARQLNFKEHEERGGLLECGCCFDQFPANCMTCCADGHLFCLDCAKRNAETTVGNGHYVFKCMDFSGCKSEFTTNEILRFVDEKTLALRDKLQSECAIREASIEGFVSCPFCDYGAIIENEEEKEFRCQNKTCGIVSCRFCRAESHIPLSCEEHAKENKISAKHIIEEAMSAALIQKCNKCTKPFVKLHGCNKMTCTCGNLQCYVCGESIQDYRHFEAVRKDGTKCPLHENTDKRLEAKIKNAQKVAVKKVLEEQRDLNEEDVKVDIPSKPTPPLPAAQVLFPFVDMGMALPPFPLLHQPAAIRAGNIPIPPGAPLPPIGIPRHPYYQIQEALAAERVAGGYPAVDGRPPYQRRRMR